MGKREGVWFLVEFDGNRGALCKAKGHKDLNPSIRQEIVSAKHKVEVELSFDFFSPLRAIPIGTAPNGQPIMGVGRESVVTGNHFMLEPCPTFINMALVTKLTFLDDMRQFDKDKYFEFVSQAEVNLEEQRKAQSPLHFVDNPKGAKLPVGPDGAIDLSKLRPAP
jgi:hypothetical protein